MKKEIEVKILNIDKRKMRKILREIGAKQMLKPTLFKEYYFKSHIGNEAFSSFRLRSEGKRCFMTIKTKEKDNQFNIHNEYEVEVGSLDSAKKILEIAGFLAFRQREKYREEYKFGSVKVEIDEYPGVSPYVEIEAGTKKEAEQFIRKIGFMPKHTTNKTATEVIIDSGLSPDNLFFGKIKPTL